MILPALRVILHGNLPGPLNMAVDDVLLAGLAPSYPYTLRFYGWSRPTVSLGYTQPWQEGFSTEVGDRHGVALVRRTTGGRAVLHDHELTYSVSGPGTEGVFSGGVHATYRVIAEGLAAGLQGLGAPVTLVRPSGRREGRREPGACFATRSRYEILARGRKILGSAQRRKPGRILQHGSLPLVTPNPRRWAVLGASGAAAAAESIGLEEILGVVPTRRVVAAALARGVAGSLQMQLHWRDLSGREVRASREYSRRYLDPAFTYRC